MVAVQKKVNTKIYDVTRPSKADNPPAGTILDHTVALREYYDYFLVPMNVNQGTVTPTHFVILTESPDSGIHIFVDIIISCFFSSFHTVSKYLSPGSPEA